MKRPELAHERQPEPDHPEEKESPRWLELWNHNREATAMEFGMVVDTTITIGNIAEVLSILGGGFLVVIRMGGDIRVMKADMSHLKSTVSALTAAFDRLGTILTQVAVQDARLIALEKRLDELAHGRGFVQNGGVNGEYPPR